MFVGLPVASRTRGKKALVTSRTRSEEASHFEERRRKEEHNVGNKSTGSSGRIEHDEGKRTRVSISSTRVSQSSNSKSKGFIPCYEIENCGCEYERMCSDSDGSSFGGKNKKRKVGYHDSGRMGNWGHERVDNGIEILEEEDLISLDESEKSPPLVNSGNRMDVEVIILDDDDCGGGGCGGGLDDDDDGDGDTGSETVEEDDEHGSGSSEEEEEEEEDEQGSGSSEEEEDEQSSSSSEEGDSSEDEDYRGELFEQSSSSESEYEEEKDDEMVATGEKLSVKRTVTKVGRPRKKRIDTSEAGMETETSEGLNAGKNGSVAQRTRSHFAHAHRIKAMPGTASHPLCVEDLEANISDDDSGNNVSNGGSEEIGTRSCGSGKGKDRANSNLAKSTKKKYIRRRKECDVDKIFLDSILGERELCLDEGDSSSSEDPKYETNPPIAETSLPLKFWYGVEESKPEEKSEEDKEEDGLWAEFEFALTSCNIGCAGDVETFSFVGKDNTLPEETGTNQASACCQGNHVLILDEEIGVKCKFCSYVHLEISHFLPAFGKNLFGKHEGSKPSEMENFVFDVFRLPGSGCDGEHVVSSGFTRSGTIWDLIPGVRDSMYPHQQEGIEFIWKNIAGGIDLCELKNSLTSQHGSGCVISHAPGTGKTRLTIVFLQSYLKMHPNCRPVIIAPRSMLLTWEAEFKKWNVDIPFHNLNKPEFSGQENVIAMNILKQIGHGKNTTRMVKLYSWKKDKSILGISYRLFAALAGERVKNGKDGKKMIKLDEHELVRKILLELPGLLVLDEGHTPRNDGSLIWKALSKINTGRRIILSGTPFQNNFEELCNILCLVRPKFVDTVSSKHHEVLQHKYGPKSSLSDDKVKEFRAMLDPFVHVHKGKILQECLRGLREYVVVLQPHQLQKSLLEGIQGMNSLEHEYHVALISVHPSLLQGSALLFYKEKKESALLDSKSFIEQDMLKRLRLNPDVGVKTKFLMELVRLSERLKEKVLVFSQFINTLVFIKEQLSAHFNWTEGKEMLYMDGQCDMKHRQSSINLFNDENGEARVLLASIKSCSEGISLVGASRVVLLDVVWNPSIEKQAICRAYRLGQEKLVYVYRLITSETCECKKYYCQAEKDRLAELVFPSKDGSKPNIPATVTEEKITEVMEDGFKPKMEDRILEVMVQHEKLKHIFDRILYQPNKDNSIETFGVVEP
ncbi:Helicase, C-terminal [Dillenia turbinata]|uniref:Helicase, C-terminal n=1 Tax=Dillenia turbinata TaxID=194707 RepID=A0AAN8VIW0_9MAGN